MLEEFPRDNLPAEPLREAFSTQVLREGSTSNLPQPSSVNRYLSRSSRLLQQHPDHDILFSTRPHTHPFSTG